MNFTLRLGVINRCCVPSAFALVRMKQARRDANRLVANSCGRWAPPPIKCRPSASKWVPGPRPISLSGSLKNRSQGPTDPPQSIPEQWVPKWDRNEPQTKWVPKWAPSLWVPNGGCTASRHGICLVQGLSPFEFHFCLTALIPRLPQSAECQ